MKYLRSVLVLAAVAALPISGAVAKSPHKVIRHSDKLGTPPSTSKCLQLYEARCYGANQLRRAYGLDKLHAKGIDGRGTKVAIIMGLSPTLREDLKAYAKAFGLPKPKLKIIKPFTDVEYDPLSYDEATLDVEAVHTVAPKAEIIFVAIPSLALSDAETLAVAVDTAVDAGANVISMSFGGPPGDSQALDNAFAEAHRKGVALAAATGDSGVTFPGFTSTDEIFVGYPASSPYVTAVGGTLLTLDNRGKRLLPDVAWGPDIQGGASGGGVATYANKPSWQKGVDGLQPGGRNIPDISMSAATSGLMINVITDPFTGKQGYSLIAGTSEASPLFAGVVALATQVAGKRLPKVNRALYKLGRNPRKNGIVDVVLGNNSYPIPFSENTTFGYPAKSGYDLVTGLGTIDPPVFIKKLAKTASE